jgi:hypothetical protein
VLNVCHPVRNVGHVAPLSVDSNHLYMKGPTPPDGVAVQVTDVLTVCGEARFGVRVVDNGGGAVIANG